MCAFLIYHQAHTSESFSLQIWKYVESGVFKLISVSLVLPIVLFLLESKFKLAKTAAKKLEDHRRIEDKTRREQVERERQERKSKRIEGISQTIKWWNVLFDLAAEIRYFKTTEGHLPTIEEPLKALNRIATSGENLINMWSFRFPNISTSDTDVFVGFFNILLKSSDTVAQSIRLGNINPKEIEVLQASLEVISEGVRAIAHHPIINVLKLSSDLLEAEEISDKKHRIDMEKHRKSELKYLTEWSILLQKLEKKHNKLLFMIDEHEGKDLRITSKRFEQWVEKNPDERNLNQPEEYNKMMAAFLKIPTESRVFAQIYYYSPMYVKLLADAVGFESFQMEVARRGRPIPRLK